MALPKLRAVSPIDEIRNVRDDVRLKGPSELLAQFERRYHLLERKRLALSYQHHFADRLPADDGPADRPLRQRLAELERDEPLQPAPTRLLPTASVAISRGLAVLSGAPVEVKQTFGEQIAEIDRLLAALGPAIAEQTEIVNAIAAEVAEELAQELLPHWNSVVLEMYRSAQQLARSTARFRELRARCIVNGIRSETLRAPNVSAPLVLGDESDNTSQITFWRKTLEEWRVL